MGRAVQPPLVPHKQHRYLGQQQTDSGDCPHRLGRHELRHPIPECSVTDLVVVLDECDKNGGRQIGARRASRTAAIGHQLALERETLR